MQMFKLPEPAARSELVCALLSCRKAITCIAILSAVINVLYLTGSLFMLQVYDRVIPSGSIPTLVTLIVLTVGMYCFQGALDVIRARLLARTGVSIEVALSE